MKRTIVKRSTHLQPRTSIAKDRRRITTSSATSNDRRITSTTVTDRWSSLVVFMPVSIRSALTLYTILWRRQKFDGRPCTTIKQHYALRLLQTVQLLLLLLLHTGIIRRRRGSQAPISLQPAMRSNGRLWASGGHATPGHHCFDRALGTLQARTHPAVQISKQFECSQITGPEP